MSESTFSMQLTHQFIATRMSHSQRIRRRGQYTYRTLVSLRYGQCTLGMRSRLRAELVRCEKVSLKSATGHHKVKIRGPRAIFLTDGLAYEVKTMHYLFHKLALWVLQGANIRHIHLNYDRTRRVHISFEAEREVDLLADGLRPTPSLGVFWPGPVDWTSDYQDTCRDYA
jgi:hypothetical protein